MIKDLDKLIKVSTFAKQKDKSVVWVYNEIYNRNIKSVEIDGVKFVCI